MNQRKKVTFILVMFLVSTVFAAKERNADFRLQHGFQLKNHVSLSSFRGTLLRCSSSCLRTAGCRSFNYHSSSGTCELSESATIVTSATLVQSPGSIYGEMDLGFPPSCRKDSKDDDSCDLDDKRDGLSEWME